MNDESGNDDRDELRSKTRQLMFCSVLFYRSRNRQSVAPCSRAVARSTSTCEVRPNEHRESCCRPETPQHRPALLSVLLHITHYCDISDPFVGSSATSFFVVIISKFITHSRYDFVFAVQIVFKRLTLL